MSKEETNNVSDVSTQAGGEGEGKNVVSFETYSKLLDQHKKTKEKEREYADKVKLYEDEKKKVEESKLKEQGEYKKLLDNRESEIKKLQEDNDNFKRAVYDGAKLQAVLEKLPGKIKKKEYLNFIDIEKIAIDPETNIIDEKTVQDVASLFVKEHSSLIEVSGKNPLPNDSGKPGSTLKYEDWVKLPLKEKKDRLKEVVN